MAGKYKKNMVEMPGKKVAVYASPRISQAIELINDMSLYEGVKILQLLEVVYDQGKKDGARNVFDEIASKVKEAEKAIPHKNPGQPKKKK